MRGDVHMDMINTNAGFTVASVRPSMNRLVAIPAKERQAGVVKTMTPHTMVVIEVNLPTGKIWRR